MSKPFKTCPTCKKEWKTRDEFLDDKTLRLNGYQVDFKELEYGMFLFTHETPECGSTMALRAKDFLDLYSGERYSENRAAMPGCPRLCLDPKQISRCDIICECAFVREVLDIIANRHK